MARRYLGYGTTNSQGIATLDHDPTGATIQGYTGVGAGKVDIVAESGSLQSEPYELLDCAFLDFGTTGHDSTNYTIASVLSEEVTSEGVTVSKTASGSTNGNYRTVTSFVSDFEALVDVKTNGQPIRVGIMDSNNSKAHATFNQSDFTTVKVTKTGTTLTVQSLTGGEWIDLAVSGLNNVDLTTNCRFLFYIYNTTNDTTLTFKNLKIYPI